MEGINELNKYFESIEDKKENNPNEIIAELQQAMTAMSRAIEQIALQNAKSETVDEIEEVKEDVEENKDTTEEVEEKEL